MATVKRERLASHLAVQRTWAHGEPLIPDKKYDKHVTLSVSSAPASQGGKGRGQAHCASNVDMNNVLATHQMG